MPLSSASLQLESEVARRYLHALAEIEPVGVESLNTAVEVQRADALPPGLFHQPVEELPSEALTTPRRIRDEVVHIEVGPVDEILQKAISRH